MSNLVLDSLEIKNFRAFKHLKIEKLGRVNLIVGKNNVGKSSVLEALWLYGRRGDVSIVWDVLRSHDELRTSVERRIEAVEQVEAAKYLFHGRQDVKSNMMTLSVGPVDAPDQTLFVSLQWVGVVPNAENGEALARNTDYEEALTFGRLNPSFIVSYGQRMMANYSLVIENFLLARTVSAEKPCVFISVRGVTRIQMGQLWDAIALTDSEADVVDALHIVSADIDRVNLIAEKGSSGSRIPVVKTKNLPFPVPLRSLGEGMNRMFGIALALVNAKDGMLLIDEVDTGLHYSVLPDLWKLIFEVAHRLNVQVFATSHSWDCIQAFQQAAADNTEEEGVLVRLENRKGGVGAVTFDEPQLAIVTREQIEVR